MAIGDDVVVSMVGFRIVFQNFLVYPPVAVLAVAPVVGAPAAARWGVVLHLIKWPQKSQRKRIRKAERFGKSWIGIP